MLQPINTTLKGTYTIYNSNKDVIAETNNLITDWGMNRLFGNWPSSGYSSTNLYAKAFAYNFAEILIGNGYTGIPNYTPAGMISTIQSSNISSSVLDTDMTGTNYTVDGAGVATIVFSRSQKYIFSNNDVIREIGCNWSNNPTGDIIFGLFSRAELNPSQQITVTNGTVVYVRYKLTITVNAYKSLAISQFKTSTGVPVFPAAKSVIKRLPFYTLESNGTPGGVLNNNAPENNLGSPQVNEYIPPLFEDFGGRNDVYVGDGAPLGASNVNTGTQGTYPGGSRKWFLGTYAVNTYSGTSLSNAVSVINHNNASTLTSTGTSGSDIEANAIIDTFGGGASSHTWTKRIQFIYPPGSPFWSAAKTCLNLYTRTRKTLDMSTTNHSNDGLIIPLETSYGPFTITDDVYVGFEFVFTFTRS
jgi:hypothetical protein